MTAVVASPDADHEGTGPGTGTEALAAKDVVRHHIGLGALVLSMREALGLVLRFGGVLAIGRIIGPSNFGIYAVASAFTFVASIIAQLGVEVFLIRLPERPTTELLHEIFSLLLVTTTVIGLIQFLTGLVIAAGAGRSEVGLAIMVCSIAVPLNVLWSPAQGAMEHDMRYSTLAAIELVGDLLLYGVGVVAAIAGLGAWAPILGMFCWQAGLIVAAYAAAPYRPRLRWNPVTNRRVIRFFSRLIVSHLVIRVNQMFLPLLTSATLGVTSGGYAQTSVRLVDASGFIQRFVPRLVLSGGARLKNDPGAADQLVARATRLQILLTTVTASPLILFPHDVVRLALGPEWLPIASVLPWYVLALMIQPVFFTVVQRLVADDELATATNLNLVRSGVWVIAMLGLGALFGLPGVAFAEVTSMAVAAVAASMMLWRRSRTPFTPILLVTMLAPLVMWTRLAPPVRPLTLVPVAMVLVMPFVRSDLRAALSLVAAVVPRRRRRVGARRARHRLGPSLRRRQPKHLAPGRPASRRARRGGPRRVR